MIRHFLIWMAVLFVAQNLARADLVKSSVLESNVVYLRVGEVGKNLAKEIQSAQNGLAASNTIAGTVLDLRFAGGDDSGSEKSAKDLLAAKKLPLAILVNGETRGAAIGLAKDLRFAKAGLIFGSSTELTPDILISASADDEKAFLENPYATAAQGDTNSAATNNFLPFIDRISEADLVREKIKDGDEDESLAATRPVEPQPPLLRDPALARAVDLIKGLAIIRQTHS